MDTVTGEVFNLENTPDERIFVGAGESGIAKKARRSIRDLENSRNNPNAADSAMMNIDLAMLGKSNESKGETRRSFLTKAAVGSALVGLGIVGVKKAFFQDGAKNADIFSKIVADIKPGDVPRILKKFFEGESFWKTIAGDVENIPEQDRIILGRIMLFLEENIEFAFKNLNQLGVERPADRRLLTPEEIYKFVYEDIMQDEDFRKLDQSQQKLIVQIMSDNKHHFINSFTADKRESNERIIIQSARTEFINRLLFDIKTLGDTNKPAKEYIESLVNKFIRTMNSYPTVKTISPDEMQLALNKYKAKLAFIFYYYLPFSANIIGTNFKQLYLHLGPGADAKQAFGSIMSQTHNPYILDSIDSTVEGRNLGSAITHPLEKLQTQSWNLEARGDDNTLHELGHKISLFLNRKNDQDPVIGKLLSDIRLLSEMEYRLLFPLVKNDFIGEGNTYGHNVGANDSYDPDEETFANLHKLLDIGYDFPNIIRERYIKKGVSAGVIDKIYGMHQRWFEYVKMRGYKGNPAWLQGEKSKNVESKPEQRAGLPSKEQTTSESDAALLSKPGGIDFNPNKLDLKIKNNGQEIKFNFDPIQLENIQIDGFVPIINNIVPITNLPLFMSEDVSSTSSGQLSMAK